MSVDKSPQSTMKKHLVTRLKTLLKVIKVDTLYYYFCGNVYMNRVAVACQKDLSSLRPLDQALKETGVDIVPITKERILPNPETQRPEVIYADEKRRTTAIDYLKKGYRGIAIVEGTEVYGDIWYTIAGNHGKFYVHPDLKWLKMECGRNDAYAFDMVLRSVKRGKNLANLLQNGALHEIKKCGCSRALGYYWADNIPALWVHRTLQWQEVKRLSVSRFFWLHFSRE